MERRERERAAQALEEVASDRRVSQGLVVEVRADLDRVLADLGAGEQDWVRAQEGLVPEFPEDWDKGRAGLGAVVPQAGDRVLVGQVGVHRQLACGPELATMAARALFREWLPGSQGELLAGAVNRQKKSFSGFLVR